MSRKILSLPQKVSAAKVKRVTLIAIVSSARCVQQGKHQQRSENREAVIVLGAWWCSSVFCCRLQTVECRDAECRSYILCDNQSTDMRNSLQGYFDEMGTNGCAERGLQRFRGESVDCGNDWSYAEAISYDAYGLQPKLSTFSSTLHFTIFLLFS